MKKDTFVKKYAKEIESGNAAVFVGAGLSIPAGYVNWKELLREIAEEIDLDIDKEDDLISLAQYHVNENNRHTINQTILKHFSSNEKTLDNHKLLSQMPIDTFWTTNYDKLIEKAIEETGKVPDVKSRVSHLTNTRPGRNAVVYKMHGDVEDPDECVLTKDDYESYHKKNEAFVTALSGDLVKKTFLFLGFSFTDPNLDYILSRVRLSLLGRDCREHYCILKGVERSDYASDADYDYNKRKQSLFIGDLKRVNIKVILVKKYSEITTILNDIKMQAKRNNIFISGSAAEYSPYTQDESLSFIEKLTATLIKKNKKIVSGFGLGVGSAVVAGSLKEIYMKQHKSDNSQLILRPFPLKQDSENYMKLWQSYREDMISYAGIAVFIFGNKKVNGELTLADGLWKEFEIAYQQGCYVIPVGLTGYKSEEIFNHITTNLDQYYPNIDEKSKSLLLSLGKTGDVCLDSVVDIVIELINKLSK